MLATFNIKMADRMLSFTTTLNKSSPEGRLKIITYGDNWLFRDWRLYHIETSPLICFANQRTGFFMIGTPIAKELKVF